MIGVGHFGPRCLLFSPAPRDPIDDKLAARLLTSEWPPSADWRQQQRTVSGQMRCTGDAAQVTACGVSRAGNRTRACRIVGQTSALEVRATAHRADRRCALNVRVVATGETEAARRNQLSAADGRKSRWLRHLRGAYLATLPACSLLFRLRPHGEDQVDGGAACFTRRSKRLAAPRRAALKLKMPSTIRSRFGVQKSREIQLESTLRRRRGLHPISPVPTRGTQRRLQPLYLALRFFDSNPNGHSTQLCVECGSARADCRKCRKRRSCP